MEQAGQEQQARGVLLAIIVKFLELGLRQLRLQAAAVVVHMLRLPVRAPQAMADQAVEEHTGKLVEREPLVLRVRDLMVAVLLLARLSLVQVVAAEPQQRQAALA